MQSEDKRNNSSPSKTPLGDLAGKGATSKKPLIDLNAESSDLPNQVAEKIKRGANILIALSKDPNVDEISAAIALAILLDQQKKHVTAIYSGKTPNTLEFLRPEDTFQKDTSGLQDFIIALNKSKADHLTYRLDGDYVKIFITPYKGQVRQEDLEYSYGDYNVDLVIVFNVNAGDEIDSALSEYGRIMHDASAINITSGVPGRFADLEWSDPNKSSVCEMVVDLAEALQIENFSEDVATALLTGILSATNRFSNSRTKPTTMSVASKLMTAGADQQLISSNILETSADTANEPSKPETNPTVLDPATDSTSNPVSSPISNSILNPAPNPTTESASSSDSDSRSNSTSKPTSSLTSDPGLADRSDLTVDPKSGASDLDIPAGFANPDIFPEPTYNNQTINDAIQNNQSSSPAPLNQDLLELEQLVKKNLQQQAIKNPTPNRSSADYYPQGQQPPYQPATNPSQFSPSPSSSSVLADLANESNAMLSAMTPSPFPSPQMFNPYQSPQSQFPSQQSQFLQNPYQSPIYQQNLSQPTSYPQSQFQSNPHSYQGMPQDFPSLPPQSFSAQSSPQQPSSPQMDYQQIPQNQFSQPVQSSQDIQTSQDVQAPQPVHPPQDTQASQPLQQSQPSSFREVSKTPLVDNEVQNRKLNQDKLNEIPVPKQDSNPNAIKAEIYAHTVNEPIDDKPIDIEKMMDEVLAEPSPIKNPVGYQSLVDQNGYINESLNLSSVQNPQLAVGQQPITNYVPGQNVATLSVPPINNTPQDTYPNPEYSNDIPEYHPQTIPSMPQTSQEFTQESPISSSSPQPVQSPQSVDPNQVIQPNTPIPLEELIAPPVTSTPIPDFLKPEAFLQNPTPQTTPNSLSGESLPLPDFSTMPGLEKQVASSSSQSPLLQDQNSQPQFSSPQNQFQPNQLQNTPQPNQLQNPPQPNQSQNQPGQSQSNQTRPNQTQSSQPQSPPQISSHPSSFQIPGV